MALKGADILFYPTAIGNDPAQPMEDSAGAWQRVMQGHAAANVLGVVASNRVGVERADGTAIDFYGSSFIADGSGAMLAECDRGNEGVITATFDLDGMRAYRDQWSLFRDRRPDLYDAVMTMDGETFPD